MRDGRDSNTPAYHSLPLSVFPDVQNVLNICCRFYVAWDEEEDGDRERERGPTIIIHTKTQANAIILLRGTGNDETTEGNGSWWLPFFSLSLSLCRSMLLLVGLLKIQLFVAAIESDI